MPISGPFQTEPEFWKTWKEFELTHGNEDTLREMLRIKRSVQATYNTKVSFMASHLEATKEQSRFRLRLLAVLT